MLNTFFYLRRPHLTTTSASDEDSFIGRDDKLEQLWTWLAPQPGGQNVVSLGGLGGMGKIQLSVRLIKRSGSQYSAVWWLNAKDENTLKAGLAALGTKVTASSATSSLIDAHEEEQQVQSSTELVRQGE